MAKSFLAGEVGIDATLDSLDGFYYLLGDNEVDLVPGQGVAIAVARDAALVKTLGQWRSVEVSVQGASTRMLLPSSAWDATAEATIEVTRPLRILNRELKAAKGRPIPLEPGTYLMQLYVRSPETITRQRPQQTEWRDGEPWPEEHMIVFSPITLSSTGDESPTIPPEHRWGDEPGVLFDEVVETDYGQFDLTWDEDGGFDGDFDRFFAGQENGLVGAADSSGIYLNLGRRYGGSALKIVLHDEATAPDLASWEDVVEVSTVVPADATPRWMTWAGEDNGELRGLAPGTYRVRVNARGRDASRDGEFADEVVDHYLVEFWRAPIAPDAIVQSQSQDADYWHQQVGHRR